jgi:hypothetical protein
MNYNHFASKISNWSLIFLVSRDLIGDIADAEIFWIYHIEEILTKV